MAQVPNQANVHALLDNFYSHSLILSKEKAPRGPRCPATVFTGTVQVRTEYQKGPPIRETTESRCSPLAYSNQSRPQ
uniref:Uncharacterized protein n=1 Tax=mine drainage metagenome TaxID=410659 RepID=E6QFW7_9ZZZZ